VSSDSPKYSQCSKVVTDRAAFADGGYSGVREKGFGRNSTVMIAAALTAISPLSPIFSVADGSRIRLCGMVGNRIQSVGRKALRSLIERGDPAAGRLPFEGVYGVGDGHARGRSRARDIARLHGCVKWCCRAVFERSMTIYLPVTAVSCGRSGVALARIPEK